MHAPDTTVNNDAKKSVIFDVLGNITTAMKPSENIVVSNFRVQNLFRHVLLR